MVGAPIVGPPANVIIWQMAAIFLPLSIACIGAALRYPIYRVFLAVASLLAFSIWSFIARLYSKTAREAREVSRSIETTWGVHSNLGVYLTHGQPALSKMSIFRLQGYALVFLTLFWITFLVWYGR